jgi:ribulose-5-phosphate 4-epimerase/fuculose-1-phosphate aldolase
MTPPPTADAVREAIVAAGRRLGRRGLIAAGEGNVSARLGNGLLITPSGRRKDELAAGDIVVIALRAADASREAGDGAWRATGPRASSDVAIHRAVYAARPDVLAVAHAHLPAAMALTLAGEVPDPAALPETALLLPRIPFVPFGAPGSEELASRVADALAEGPEPLPGAVLLERHGAVAVGDTAGEPIAAVAQAVDRLELVEVLCRTWRDALLVRAATSAGDARAILRAPGPGPGSPARGTARREP